MPSKKSKKSKSLASKLKNFNFNAKYLAITLIFAFTASLILAPTFAARGGVGKKSKQPSVGIYVTSNSNSVKNGGLLTVDIWTNSLDEQVNAVQAEVSYPASQLEVVDINSTDSAFSISAQEIAQNGLIKLARGANPPVNGTSKVASVTFRAIGSNGKANISAANSKLLSANTNEDITTSNGKLSVRIAK